MDFEIIGAIQDIETIAVGSRIRDIAYLQKVYGGGRWRKLKGIADVRLPNGKVRRAGSAFKDAWAMAMTLPRRQRRTLAERLLRESAGESVVVVTLHRSPPSVQARLDELLTKNNEGQLTPEERDELTDLVDEGERTMLANTEILLRASRPELFDASGRLVRFRLARALARETG